MSDLPSSARNSALGSVSESPSTPSPQDSRSSRTLNTPGAPNPERTSRLPNMTAATNKSTVEAMEAMMVQMQNTLQQQLQLQPNEFQVRMEALLIGKGKAVKVPVASSSTPFKQPIASRPPTAAEEIDEAQIGIATNDPQAIQEMDENLHRSRQSQYVRQPSFPSTYAQNHVANLYTRRAVSFSDFSSHSEGAKSIPNLTIISEDRARLGGPSRLVIGYFPLPADRKSVV